jgi:hypothetical protein
MATSPPIFEDASFDPEMTGIMVEAYEKALPMASRHRTAERRRGAHRNKRIIENAQTANAIRPGSARGPENASYFRRN